MDVFQQLQDSSNKPITCIDMHTTGEPTRIIIDGYPGLSGGTLLEQRAEAIAKHDHIRRRYSLEPRGHFDMYGAILRPDTELTRTGEAHMGVLFTTNGGYSTMCGHATIALGRFLYDTRDQKVFPRRSEIPVSTSENDEKTATVKLHAPCGLLTISVPLLPDESRSDPARPVSFLSVPSFTTGVRVKVPIPPERRWAELDQRKHIEADFTYGGAFYCVLPLRELGFDEGLATVSLDATNTATCQLKAAVNENPELRHLFSHPDHNDLGFLYGVMLVDDNMRPPKGTFADEHYHEVGLLYFADQSVDRSPTGSAVAARMALASTKGEINDDDWRTYHSLVSVAAGWKGGFRAKLSRRLSLHLPAVEVVTEGFAYYTGVQKLVVEADDFLGDDGFIFGHPRG